MNVLCVSVSATNSESVCCLRRYLRHQLKELTSLFNEMKTVVVCLTSDSPDWAASARIRSRAHFSFSKSHVLFILFFNEL